MNFKTSLLVMLVLALTGSVAGAVILDTNGSPYAWDPNLRLWLDASNTGSLYQDPGGTNPVTAGGQSVGRWVNSSMYGGAVLQSNAGNQPSYTASVGNLNSMPALYFDNDSINGALNLTGISGNQDRTVISVWSNAVDTGANYQHAMHMGNTGGNQAYGQSVDRAGGNNSIGNHYWGAGFDTSASGLASPTVAVSIWDGDGGSGSNGLDSWWVNGAAVGASDRGALNTGNSQLTIGSRLAPTTEGMRGDLAEIIVYDTVLTTAERNRIGGYLETKYGIVIAGADFIPGPNPPPPTQPTTPNPTINNFDDPGTPYTVATATAPAAVEVTASGGNDFLRLIHQQGSNRNFVGFDRTTAGTVDEIQADWDMRMFKNNTSGDQRMGDGFSVGLLSTDVYGNLGAAPATDTNPEKWELIDSLSIGFIGFDGSYGGKKDIEVYFDGTKIGPTINSPVDFTYDAQSINDPDENAPWIHNQLLIDFPETGGANLSLYLGGTEDAGSGIAVFENLFIANMDPYEARLAFGGRNGSAINFTDLDNINVRFGPPIVPEPSTFAIWSIAIFGFTLLIRLRKK